MPFNVDYRGVTAGPLISPGFVARGARFRCDAMRAMKDGAGVAVTTSNRLERVRLVSASKAVAAGESWWAMRASRWSRLVTEPNPIIRRKFLTSTAAGITTVGVSSVQADKHKGKEKCFGVAKAVAYKCANLHVARRFGESGRDGQSRCVDRPTNPPAADLHGAQHWPRRRGGQEARIKSIAVAMV